MEYEFITDPVKGCASAKFSFEHENIGPWLEIELADNAEKLKEILIALDEVEHGKKARAQIVGHEFSLIIEENDVVVQNNTLFNGFDNNDALAVPEDLELSEQNAQSRCGIEDFRALLLSWSKFVH